MSRLKYKRDEVTRPPFSNREKEVDLNYKNMLVRGRLLRRIIYRAWKAFALLRGKKLIAELILQNELLHASVTPIIILSTYSRLEDFLVLTYIFRDRDLALISVPDLPQSKVLNQLKSYFPVLHFNPQAPQYSFLKQFLHTLKVFRRSVILSPEAAQKFLNDFSFNHGNLVRLSIRSGVPIQPVIITWSEKEPKRCKVVIGKEIHLSPTNPEFSELITWGMKNRKTQLTKELLEQIGNRISRQINELKFKYGSNLSKKMDAGQS